jgi:poly [ADP-ribose] polymerase 6/8
MRPALCFSTSHSQDINKHGDIWVHPHQDMVCTRFFFVFPEGLTGNATQCRTDNTSFAKELLDALAFYQ